MLSTLNRKEERVILAHKSQRSQFVVGSLQDRSSRGKRTEDKAAQLLGQKQRPRRQHRGYTLRGRLPAPRLSRQGRLQAAHLPVDPPIGQ